MNSQNDKVQSIISERRIKLHIFEPSKRKIWTVVGKGEEHWIDPERNYCSCPGYYFNQLNNKADCYHIGALKRASKENKIEQIVFSDEEYADFISSLVSDL